MNSQHPNQRAQASVWIDAPPTAVWRVIANVHNLGRFSPETTRTEWLTGPQRHEVGAMFRGHNRNDRHAWHTDCAISEFTELSAFAFDVSPEGNGRFSTRWRYSLEAEARGTRLTESFESPALADRPAEMNPERHRVLVAMLEVTLHAIKSDIENGGGPSRLEGGSASL